MSENNFIKTVVQKGRVRWCTGCLELTSVISQLITEIIDTKTNFAIALLDMTYAYCTIPHKFIKEVFLNYDNQIRSPGIWQSSLIEYIQDSTVLKLWVYRNTKKFLPQENVTRVVFCKTFRNFWSRLCTLFSLFLSSVVDVPFVNETGILGSYGQIWYTREILSKNLITLIVTQTCVANCIVWLSTNNDRDIDWKTRR